MTVARLNRTGSAPLSSVRRGLALAALTVGGLVACFDATLGPKGGVIGAQLPIVISGLPTGAEASVTVTGPGGFVAHVPNSTTLTALTAGTYTIEADSLELPVGRFAPVAVPAACPMPPGSQS